jgi:hypothetical protein
MFDSAQKAQYMDGHREKFMRLVHLFEDTSVMFSQLFKAQWTIHFCNHIYQLLFI